MRSLLESIFDKDNIKKEVEIGVLYKLSEEHAHYNEFTNNVVKFIDLFKAKELSKVGPDYKYVDKEHGFIKYWDNIYGWEIGAIVDVILHCPAIAFQDKNNYNVEKKLKEHLKDYIHPYDYKDINIFIRRFESDRLIEITIYDDIGSSQPNSMKITLEKI